MTVYKTIKMTRKWCPRVFKIVEKNYTEHLKFKVYSGPLSRAQTPRCYKKKDLSIRQSSRLK